MASEILQPLQGMSDISFPEIELWRLLENKARRIFSLYGYREIRTPLLERTPLFLRSLGDTSEVVCKEMYSFEDRGGRDLTLRPEGTAGVIRNLAGLGPAGLNSRVYYIGPMFRCERPQAGRKRQFHQIGVEMTGDPNPRADAECIALQNHLLREVGLKNATIKVNTRGSIEDRKAVSTGLLDALEPNRENLCNDCQRRMEENILRVLDCKNPECQKIVNELPKMTDFMSDESAAYLDEVMKRLEDMGVVAQIDPSLVRGLDYYEHTVWEITHDALGAQDALCGGGRYKLEIGKKSVPGVGFAVGVERTLNALQAEGVEPSLPGMDFWLISLGDAALKTNLKLAQRLRERGLSCQMELETKSMKAQMRKADRARATWAVIRGENELADDIICLRNMKDGTQQEVSCGEALATLERVAE